MTKVSEETVKTLHSVLTEITASMVLNPKNDEDRVWNEAIQKTRRIIMLYKEGKGFFQQ